MNADQIIERIYGEDIYAQFDGSGLEQDLQGWGGLQFLIKTIERLRPQLIIEVGVWKGRSALAMADRLKELNLSSPVVCVDTFLGSEEHFRERFRPDMNRKAGWPQLYEQFMFNVLDCKHQDVIVPIPASSLAAAQILKEIGVQADLIHIDAGHGYLEVRSDIQAFWPLLTEDGVMVFDDYGRWKGVTKAVNELAAEKELPLIGTHGKAILSPSMNVRFTTNLDKIAKGSWTPK